ncbi:hypothetical protein [Luteimonas salinilitoris]|uniref:Uncharacterized protein n=1 Tax=Luteimonas salinilitoris TaxID=3237697 RepID=A0ABV4HSC3_9GAMM
MPIRSPIQLSGTSDVIRRGEQQFDESFEQEGSNPDWVQDEVHGPVDVYPAVHQLDRPEAYKRQERYVTTFKRLTGKNSPLAVLRRPGSSYTFTGSVDVGVDVISTALTAAAHGIPVPSSLLASLTPGLQLQVSGTVNATDTAGVAAAVTLKLTESVSADVASGVAASAKAGAGQSLSVKGLFSSLEHFVAHYLRKVTNWLKPFAGREYKKRDKEWDLEAYRRLRELGKKRRTRVVGAKLSGEVEAKALTLFGAGVEASFAATRATRKRNLPAEYIHGGFGSKRHEYRHGYVVEASAKVDAGPIGGGVTLSVIHNDANPDNDGIYITATLSGTASAALSLAQAAPEALSDITFSAGNMMEALGGTLSGTISKMNLPIGSASLGAHASTDVTLVWYQPGKVEEFKHGSVLLPQKNQRFHLLYVRTTDEIGANLGASGIPLYGGLAAGLGGGGDVRRARKETLGHHSIAYVQALYMGMKGHQRRPWAEEGAQRKNDWDAWERKHEADLRKMQTSGNVRQELTKLAGELDKQETVQLARDTLDDAYNSNDFERWLLVVKWLFNSEAHRRSGAGGVSEGYTKYSTIWDVGKILRHARR